MGIVEALASQFARPHGWLAPVTARVLNVGNRKINHLAISALRLHPGDRVLDIGFGGGVGITRALREVGPAGHVTGLDVSHEMIQRARRRWRHEVKSETLDLYEASVEAIPVEDGSFDAVYTVNSVFFWPDVIAAVVEIGRVMAPGARAVFGYQPSALRQWQRLSRHDIADAGALMPELARTGFVRVEQVMPGHNVALVLAARP